MAVMAKWGPKEWAVSADQILTLQDMSFSYTQEAEDNDSIEEQKTTNELGMELFPLSFSTTLNAAVGVDVRGEIDSWAALVTQSYYFYLNGVQLGPGELQLRSVNVDGIVLDDFGRMRVATLSFEFKEYDPNPSTSSSTVGATTSDKVLNSSGNTVLAKTTATGISPGDRVRIIGTKYMDGKPIETGYLNNPQVVRIAKTDRVFVGNGYVRIEDVSLL